MCRVPPVPLGYKFISPGVSGIEAETLAALLTRLVVAVVFAAFSCLAAYLTVPPVP